VKSIVFKCFLKVAAHAVFPSDVGSRFQACGPATENSLEPTDDNTRTVPLSAECRHALPGSVESGTTAC